ncbi:hypothetical protein Q6344_09325 [Psychrobacter cibarius]|nr:hypothetical protein Q6344_09325 [Psychrobacter cibarius]
MVERLRDLLANLSSEQKNQELDFQTYEKGSFVFSAEGIQADLTVYCDFCSVSIEKNPSINSLYEYEAQGIAELYVTINTKL